MLTVCIDIYIYIDFLHYQLCGREMINLKEYKKGFMIKYFTYPINRDYFSDCVPLHCICNKDISWRTSYKAVSLAIFQIPPEA